MPTIIKKLLLGTALTLGMNSAVLADDELSDNFSRCIDRSGGVTVNMLNCIADETEYQDVLLNRAYKELMATLEDDRKTQLRNAQRAWIKYRDLNCDFYLDPDGGTMASIMSSDCYMSSTAARARELEAFRFE